MPSITVAPFPLNAHGGKDFCSSIDVTDYTFIDGVQEQGEPFVAQLVIAYGNLDLQGLKQAVDKVVHEFIRAQSAPDQMSPEEKAKRIEELRRSDDESPPCSYSRKCAVCATDSPVSRATLTECGHVLCLACVLEMENKGRLLCPFCRKSSGFVKMHEEKGDEEAHIEAEPRSSEPFPAIHNRPPSRSTKPSIPRASSSSTYSTCSHVSSSSVHNSNSPSNQCIAHRYLHVNHPTHSHHSTSPNPSPPFHQAVPNIIHISNLAPQTTPSDLVKLFSKAGKVVAIHAPLIYGRPLGFAYCQFRNERSAHKAVSKFHSNVLAGHVLSVRMG